MTDERWREIIGLVKSKFKVINQTNQDLPDEAGKGTVEILEFMGPLGQMKIERTTQLVVLDKKTFGSRRIGSTTAVEYVYSDTEVFHKFKAYQFDENDQVWVEMKMGRDDMIF